jgi:hypothetical protein
MKETPGPSHGLKGWCSSTAVPQPGCPTRPAGSSDSDVRSPSPCTLPAVPHHRHPVAPREEPVRVDDTPAHTTHTTRGTRRPRPGRRLPDHSAPSHANSQEPLAINSLQPSLHLAINCLRPSLHHAIDCLRPSLHLAINCLRPSLHLAINCLRPSLHHAINCLQPSLDAGCWMLDGACCGAAGLPD